MQQQEGQWKAETGAGGRAGSWQGWLTGWYGRHATDTTNDASDMKQGKGAGQMFMGDLDTRREGASL